MKRFVTIMIVLLCFVSAITVYADFINPTITDSVGYLTEEQNKELSARLDKIREQYNFDIVFVSLYQNRLLQTFQKRQRGFCQHSC